MYHYAGPWISDRWGERNEHGVKVRAAMTKNKNAKLQVYVDSNEYDTEGDKEHHYGCHYAYVSKIINWKYLHY